MEILEIYALVCEYCLRAGAPRPMVGQTWINSIDDNWAIAINGKKEPQELRPDKSMGCKLKEGEVAIFYNGWLAAIITPFQGEICAGEAANERSFRAALVEAMRDLPPWD